MVFDYYHQNRLAKSEKSGYFKSFIMNSLAIILVLSAAFVHAFWNLLAKRAGGGVVFIWLFASLSSAIYAPISCYILWVARPQIGLIGLAFS